MVDPLSITASIVSLLQLSAVVVKYISGEKDAPDDLKRLMLEISSIKGMLSDSQDLVQSGGAPLSAVQSLSTPNGPLERFRSSLKRLDKNLTPVTGFNKATKMLVWPFQKGEVKDILCMIEGQKPLSSSAKLPHVSSKDQMSRDIVDWISALNFSTKQDDFFARRQEGTGEWLLEADAVSVCAGLVTIDQESKIIRLVHYTTQEYFVRIRMTRFPCAQTSIAMTCLVYISFDTFAKGHCRSDQEMEARLHDYPLLEYAVRNWGDHARGNPESAVGDLALKFLQHGSKRACYNQVMSLPGFRCSGYSQDIEACFSELHITASLGLAGIMQLLLSHEGVDANSRDKYGRTPLLLAAANGHGGVVQLLLSHEGVDVDSEDWQGRTPLLRAAEEGHERVMQLLLSHEGVNANSKGEYSQTPLLLAAANGHGRVVQLLLSQENIDASSKDEFGQTPLMWAANEGHQRVAQLIRSHEGADAEFRDWQGRTLLSRAAEKGHESVVPLLLSHEGVYADSKDMSGRTPLSLAAEGGYDRVVRLLLSDKCVDADSTDDEHGMTSLLLAAEKGHEGIVQLLLSHEGVDANFKDKFGRTPLSLAAWKGHERVVQLLLSREDIDAGSKDEYDQTPLLLAAENGHGTVVQLLLSQVGVDANSQNTLGQTPLLLAAADGHKGVVQLLLSQEGVDADSQDISGQTPLLLAAANGHEKIVQLFTLAGRY
ncbi:hypothetical protein GP486_004540 [Trichoglossum hirsutum]|uniref:Ankyrin repeat protein n=1 Tax=Trichoglossum hirsutum TaxID=265104 RepID=A0A9P8RPJ5_9PEZI|nr:hypothetical protein GP486_004540 [Trichoglossum hirsutum]